MIYCYIIKTNDWKMLHVKVWRGEGKGMSDQFFSGSMAKIGGWMEKCWEDGGCEKCIKGE